MQFEFNLREEMLLIFSIRTLIEQNRDRAAYWLDRSRDAGPLHADSFKNRAARYQAENMELQTLLARVDTLVPTASN